MKVTKKITMMWQVLLGGERKLMKCKKFCGGGERSAFLGVDVGGNAPILQRGEDIHIFMMEYLELKRGEEQAVRIDAIRKQYSKKNDRVKRMREIFTDLQMPLIELCSGVHLQATIAEWSSFRSSFPAIMEAIAVESRLRLTTGGNQAVVELATQASEKSHTDISPSVDSERADQKMEMISVIQ
ncbi:hypothetical protein HAX54_002052 [Datura stramonium]|uniref:Uncharacterized protein n=1 Tax=Datura stramonium TaxID=4076 RepID=A0ABS8T3Z0_DATST|nr:hypothetical protein [Datura stramonium]